MTIVFKGGYYEFKQIPVGFRHLLTPLSYDRDIYAVNVKKAEEWYTDKEIEKYLTQQT